MKKILILGAGVWQTPYIIKASQLGFSVFATDWEKNAIGGQYADVFEQIDLKNVEDTIRFAKRNHVDAIFTSADIGVPTAAIVAKELGLGFHSTDLAMLATNKYKMRQRAEKIGLPIPEYAIAHKTEEAIKIAGEIGFPVIIKPVDSCSSRGVFLISDKYELLLRVEESLASSNAKEVLIEEFMTGTEGSVEALVINGTPLILGICDKIKSELPYRYDLELNYPGKYTIYQYKLIQNFIEKLVSGYEIKDGIIHVEIMVNNDSVRLIEFAIRGCGSKVVTHLIPAMTGFDVVEYLLLQALNINKEIKIRNNLNGKLQFIMLQQGKIKIIEGIDIAKKVSGIIDIDVERKSGDVISEIKNGRSRPGYILAVGKSRDEIQDIIGNAMDKIKISYY